MKGCLMLLCAGTLAVILAGCAQAPRPAVRRASLLFDPEPGVYNAVQYAARTTWLTAPSHFEEGETIYYREYFYDYQGDGFGTRDYFLRRFRLVREGRGYR